MSLVDVHLKVPAERSTCAGWILCQDPVTVADALALCEAAFAAVNRDVAEGEVARLQQLHHMQVQSLQEQLEQEKELKKEALREAKMRSDNVLLATGRRQKETCDELQRQLELCQEAYRKVQQNSAEEKSALHQELERQAREIEATQVGKISAMQKTLDDLDAQLTEAKLSKQRVIDEVTTVVTCRMEKDRERRETQLLSEVDSLKRDLELKRGSEAQVILEEKRRSEDAMERKDAEHRRTLQQLNEERVRYESFLTAALEKRSSELADALASKDASAQRVETLVAEQHELVSRLGGSVARGQMGERFVAGIFAKLQLGDWQDDHGVKEDGYADALWTWQPSSTTPLLSCLVEVKYVAELHSQHDVAKFHRDLQAAASKTRANAGLFISLAKHCTGKPSLQLTMEHGMPVCYASRDEDDALPAASLVQLAFQAMATAWPLICRQRGEGVELTVRAAAEQLEKQLGECEILSKHIGCITRSATSLLREAKALERLRDSMVKGVEGIRMNHPSLVPEIPDLTQSEEGDDSKEREEDLWSSEGARLLMEAIRSAKKGARYPKEADLALEGEAARFLRETPHAFVLTVERLKKDVGSRGRKRKSASIDGNVEHDDDQVPAAGPEEAVPPHLA